MDLTVCHTYMLPPRGGGSGARRIFGATLDDEDDTEPCLICQLWSETLGTPHRTLRAAMPHADLLTVAPAVHTSDRRPSNLRHTTSASVFVKRI